MANGRYMVSFSISGDESNEISVKPGNLFLRVRRASLPRFGLTDKSSAVKKAEEAVLINHHHIFSFFLLRWAPLWGGFSASPPGVQRIPLGGLSSYPLLGAPRIPSGGLRASPPVGSAHIPSGGVCAYPLRGRRYFFVKNSLFINVYNSEARSRSTIVESEAGGQSLIMQSLSGQPASTSSTAGLPAPTKKKRKAPPKNIAREGG